MSLCERMQDMGEKKDRFTAGEEGVARILSCSRPRRGLDLPFGATSIGGDDDDLCEIKVIPDEQDG